MAKMKRILVRLREEFCEYGTHVWTDWDKNWRYCVLCKLEERID